MCGIAGIVAWDHRYRVTRPLLEKMSACIAHRGPDGEGISLNHEQEASPARPQVGFVHRRLAILDPDPRSNQPFGDEAGRWLVFNGEIYNYRELRQELRHLRPDYKWRTDGDTEVLLLSYAVWGEQCVEHLNGMFAFAVWDEPNQRLFLARDRMGQKPLYVNTHFAWSHTPGPGWILPSRGSPMGVVAFASEIPSLLQLPWVDRSINPATLGDYTQLGYSFKSIYTGIDQLSPGLTLTATTTSILDHGYWNSSATSVEELNSRRVSDAEAVEKTRSLIHAAVRKQLVSDVPIGCFLSGGIDSSVVVAAMRRALPDAPIRTFSIGFDDRRYDETEYAAAVARHYRTEHHRFVVRPDAATDLPRIAAAFGEPFGDSSALPTYYLARQTREVVKVCLSGDGGDELFGGYDRYRAMRWADRLRRIVSPTGRALLGNRVSHIGRPKSKLARITRFLSSLDLDDERRYQRYMLLDGRDIGDLIPADKFPHTGTPDTPIRMAFRFKHRITSDVVTAALATDRQTYLPGDLLTKVDRCSMVHALEVRSPFMDHELVQFADGLTTDQLLRGGPKRMLREAFANDLPGFVFKRKKMGFAVPIGEWFRGDLRPMLRDHLFSADSFASHHFVRKTVERLVDEHESRRFDHSQRLYALLMLELWWRDAKSMNSASSRTDI